MVAQIERSSQFVPLARPRPGGFSLATTRPSWSAGSESWTRKDRRVVRLAGRLGEAQVPELFMACGESRALRLHLSDLLSADAVGLEALQRVQARGATFVGVPGYIRLQLTSPSPTRKRGRDAKL